MTIKANEATLKEFLDVAREKYKCDSHAMDSFLLGYLSGFIERNMTPTIRNKMQEQLEYVKSR